LNLTGYQRLTLIENENNLLSTEQIQECKKRIANGEVDTVIDLLIENKTSKKREKELLMYSARYKDLRRSLNIGTISNSEFQLGTNQITSGVLDFLVE